MAAWTARLDAISTTGTGERLLLSVTFYDATDTAFTNVLSSKVFEFPLETTAASMAAQVRTVGRNVRAGQDAAAALRVAVPVGTTIAIA